MQIKLTWRRVTLAAVVVVAGVAAPLAWAAVGGKPASAKRPAVPAAEPAPARSAALALAPQSANSTGDNPYQVVRDETFIPNQTACVFPAFPAGVNFALDQVSALTDAPFSGITMQFAWLRVWTKGTGGVALPTDLFLTLENGGKDAFRSDGIDWVVKPNSLGAAAVGDIYDLQLCVQNGPTTGRVTAVITGQRISNTATAASVRDFSARPRAHGALLSWTTGSESNLLGFNVWRFRNGKGVKVNRTLVEAKRSGEPTGASYTFLDSHPGARQGLTYRLQLVDPQGKRSWYAAFAIPA